MRLEERECALDLSKNLEDHFIEDPAFAAILERLRTNVESDDSSVDPDIYDSIDDEPFGMKSNSSSMASKSSDTHMEDVTKSTSCIDFTNIDNNGG